MAAVSSVFRDAIRPYIDLPAAVHVLCLGSFVNRAGSFVMVFMTIYVSEQLGFGVAFAANCFGVFGVGSVVSSLAGGLLADRFGRKPIMLLALSGGSIALAIMPFATEQWSFLGLVLAFALAVEMYRPAASAMMGDLVHQTQRPLAFALMYIAFNLGFAFAAPIGGVLAQHSFLWLFWGDALTTAAYGLIIVFFIKETLPKHGAEPGDAADNATSNNIQKATWSEALVHMKGDRTFVLFSFATLLTSLVFMQAFSTLPIYLSQLGFSKAQVGWLLSTNGILIVICQIPFTHFLNRFHRVLVILGGELLLAAGFGLTTFAETAPMFFLTIVIWTLGEVCQAAFKQSLVADLAPTSMRGRYMGVFSLCHAIGLTVGAPAGGQILGRWGAHVLWPTCFLIVVLAACVYAIVYGRLEHIRTQQEAAAATT